MVDNGKKDKINNNRNRFRETLLNPDAFCITWEQTPGRGSVEASQAEVIENSP